MRATFKATKATLLMFSVAVLLAGGSAVRGQSSSLDGFDPNANGTISAIVVQPDGKILIGGDFTTLSPNGGAPVTRNYIARLDPDGALDTAFNPNADSAVSSIAVQADGQILASGFFTSIGGQTRNYIARLEATTGAADSTFNPNSDSPVYAVAVQADGQIVVAGEFTNIGGQTRNFIARLDGTTGLADSFDPNADSHIFSIALQADGKILVGGQFKGVGGQMRKDIARLDGTTGLADSFDPNPSGCGVSCLPGPRVQAVAVQADGQILAGGIFSSIGGQTRNDIARLDATTGLADSFDPNAGGVDDPTVNSITVQTDGKILAGGSFTGIGGQTRNNIARLDATTGLADSFDPNANGPISAIAVQADGKILLGGDFTNIGGQTRNHIARLTPPSMLSISGTVLYCSNPVPGPVPDVTLTLTGSGSDSTLSDGLGDYTFSSLTPGGTYTVTPSKVALVPASAGINTFDVIAAQRHFLNLGTPLSGCRLTAADVNGDSAVNTFDVIAIQRFFLGRSTGIANTGNYQFTPASRTYTSIVTDETGQDYDTLVFGDAAAGFVHRPDDGSQDAAGEDTSASEVAAVALPEIAAAQSRSNFIAAVTTTALGAANELVGFQGDFTFDERVVTFQSEPVHKAGLTGGNWNVSGNVLPGSGPIRTLRISAFSNDFTPLSGEGTLFELRMNRVSKAAQGTQLIWAAPPDQFIFIDADLNTRRPINSEPDSVTPAGKRK